MRESKITRKTNETDIELSLKLDGSGISDIVTGVGFLDHMLTLFSKHSGFDISLKCKGDTYVDDHHSVEDTGIALGLAFSEAIGDKLGIERYGDFITAMDEALVLSSVDISGRDYLNYNLNIPTQKVGTFDTELAKEFWLGFVRNARITLHLIELSGENSHHILECSFKSAAKALQKAAAVNPFKKDALPSTKGVL